MTVAQYEFVTYCHWLQAESHERSSIHGTLKLITSEQDKLDDDMPRKAYRDDRLGGGPGRLIELTSP